MSAIPARRRVFLLISGDPRASHRPAEALRVAAGLLAWRQVEVQVFLRGDARRLLDDTPGELVDEEEINRCLPIVAGEPGCLWVEEPELAVPEGRRFTANTRVMSLEKLAELAAACDSVLTFES